MSILAALFLDFLAMMWVDYVRKARAARPAVAEAFDDGEPVLDFEEVRDDVDRIATLLVNDENDLARVECERLLDRMHGIDEAARADERWRAHAFVRAAR